MKRSTLSGYENGVSEPNLEALVAFSKYFAIKLIIIFEIRPKTIEIFFNST